MKTLLPMLVLCGIIVASTYAAESESDVIALNTDKESMIPFWKCKRMVGESVLFMKNKEGKPTEGKVLFAPVRIEKVTDSTGKITYQEGKDYQLTKGSNILTIPAGSTIPVAEPEKLYQPAGSQPFGVTRRDGKSDIFFAGALQYQEMQVLVTYEYAKADWTGPVTQLAEKELPLTLAKLRAGEPVKVVLFGDSISEGGNASKLYNVEPFSPPYGGLVIQNLKQAYKSPITFVNRSKGGMGSEWGCQNMANVVSEKPDLAILAWGMNDCCVDGEHGETPFFVQCLQNQMEQIRKENPKVEFILVASMLGNAEWRVMRADRLLSYRDGLKKLVAPGIAVADVASVWEELLKVKPYQDFTGNGVNHPNDYGHRLYAQVLSALLIGY